jgi:hypothetical protein
MTELS